MGYPRILYQNRATGATITSSCEASGYPDDNAANWRDYLRWHTDGAGNTEWIKINCGSGMTANCVALAGHNLNDFSGRAKLEGSNNDADWTEVQAYFTPSNNYAIARFFTQVTYQYYRLTIDNNGGANFTAQLGVLFVGNYLEMPEFCETGFDPDRQRVHGSRQQSETGRILGMAVEFRERLIEVDFRFLTRAWVSGTWIPFWDAYYDQPFIWVWDYENHATAVYLMEWNMDVMTIPFDKAMRMPLHLSMRGLLEE